MNQLLKPLTKEQREAHPELMTFVWPGRQEPLKFKEEQLFRLISVPIKKEKRQIMKRTIRKIFKKRLLAIVKDTSLILLNKELSNQVEALKDENQGIRDICDSLQRDMLRQSQLRQQAETRANQFELQKGRENSINADATNDKLVMQGVLFRAREVSTAMVPLLEEASEALTFLPAPKSGGEREAIAVITKSLGTVNRYANMIGNDNKGTENLLITTGMMDEITTGMMDEKAKQTGEPSAQTGEAKELKLLLEKRFKGVGVVDIRNRTGLQVQLSNGESTYTGDFNSLFPPERILKAIEDELAAAASERGEDRRPEGSGNNYEAPACFPRSQVFLGAKDGLTGGR